MNLAALDGWRRGCRRGGLLVAVLAAVAVAPALAETITITEAGCAALVAHVADADVAYRPGVDVDGEAVAPADLPGAPQVVLPDIVHIPITVDLARRFGIPATSDLFKAEAYIGTARVDLRDGRAWFNGKPLSDPEAHALARLCQEQRAREPAR